MAMEALNSVDLADLAKKTFAVLSGGQRQRVLLARALVGKPEILLLDEPMANVDRDIEGKLYDSLRQLNRNTTILVVTHDFGFVTEMVKHVICVNRTAVMHPTSEVSGKVIEELYRGGIRMVHHDRHSHSRE